MINPEVYQRAADILRQREGVHLGACHAIYRALLELNMDQYIMMYQEAFTDWFYPDDDGLVLFWWGAPDPKYPERRHSRIMALELMALVTRG